MQNMIIKVKRNLNREASGKIDKDEVIVCVTTGHGLKDPDITSK